MDNKINSNTNKKLLLLIAVFLIGFLSLFLVNRFFLNVAADLDKKTANVEAKLKIGDFISYDILKIRALFHELATTTTSQKSRDVVLDKIDDTIEATYESLDVLEHGGTLTRFIALNIAGHLNTIKRIHYIKNAKETFDLEVISVKPKLEELRSMIKDINHLLQVRSNYQKAKNTKEFMRAAKKVRRYYKRLPAHFDRISENIKRLLYEGDLELSKLKKQINIDKARYLKIKLYLILIVIFVVIILGYIIIKAIKKDSEKLFELNMDLNETLSIQEKQEKSIRAILDAQSNIIIVTDGIEMTGTNLQLIKFLEKFEDFEDFKSNHDCICDFFETNVPSDEYITKKDYDGITWIDYILKYPEKNFKVIMKKDGLKHHFLIQATKTIIDENTGESVVVITLNDITSEINSQVKLASMNENLELLVTNKTKELNELNENLEQKIIIETEKVRKKDKQMTTQARSAAMGEMIGNIAHQWRQPLSAINTTASGMDVQMQLGLASNEEISESFHKIMEYVDFLTQTIEDFRGFLKEDKEKTEFNVIDTLNKTLFVTNASYRDTDINIINETKDKELISFGMPSELSQVFLNILNNARDVLVEKEIKNKLVYIKCEQTNNLNIIYIQDNAGGIPKDIIDKIFDPYFTTKHHSQGTGIGLYMSKTIIEKTMYGEIDVKNRRWTANESEYFGACFIIKLPKI